MSWVTEALGGPVLAWEIKRATRRSVWRCIPLGYCAWLVIQALFLFAAFDSGPPQAQGMDPPIEGMERFRRMTLARLEFFENYLALLLQLQLELIIVLVPGLTASSLGLEKERGTLFALFGTQLTSRQILLGKFVGRLMLIVPIILTMPVFVFLAIATGRALTPILLALMQEAILAIAVGAIGLLFAIWIRNTADAVIASYLFLGTTYLIFRGLLPSWPGAALFDPVANLRDLIASGPRWVFAAHLAVWVALGATCLRLGWGRLRKVCWNKGRKDRRADYGPFDRRSETTPFVGASVT